MLSFQAMISDQEKEECVMLLHKLTKFCDEEKRLGTFYLKSKINKFDFNDQIRVG